MTVPEAEPLIICLRAYADAGPSTPFIPKGPNGEVKKHRTPRASPWTLVFDTETTTDAGQSLRFGAYQVRHGEELRDSGLFYEPDGLTADELGTLTHHADTHGLTLMTRATFIEEVFYGIGYELRATIVGLNLPYDIARLAIDHASARGDMRGGFTFKLSADKRRPRVQVKHLSARTSLIRFSAPFRQRQARSERKRGDRNPVRRGFFVDIRTFAAAQFTRSFSLEGLADFLGVEHPKHSTDEHGKTLTDAYVAYGVGDVQTTWECYAELARRYQTLGLADTPPPMVYSEASIGKAYLKAMGVKPWREVQPGVPPKLLATILSAYFGGRSEVRIRRELRQVVLCDFLSMYPTVCTLMNLWRFVTADGMTWRDGTEEIRAYLDTISLADLQRQEAWRLMCVLVQVEATADIFPIRAPYADEGQATIGLNHLSSDKPLWFTLADCIASKLATGRPPKILQALVFDPGEQQSGLLPTLISGKLDYRVDPALEDFFKRLIELRQSVKRRLKQAPEDERDGLDAEQNALKIAANATSYGVFVEINVKEKAKRSAVKVHTAQAAPYTVETINDEEPGRYFHPLLATLITGAARLMLAITERLVSDEGLEWAFCDTDSMAIAKPDWMGEADFQARAGRIVAWFAELNPYDFPGSILKVEDVNFGLGSPGVHEPLYVWAVSAKRYALFNLDPDGRPILRKAMAHGLGHIRAPYGADDPARDIPAPTVELGKIGVELWQHDLWWTTVSAALAGHPDKVRLDYHPALNTPAISRYAATTPPLLNWFKPYNRNLPYARQVKPFGFLMAPFADPFFDGAGDRPDAGPTPGRGRAKPARQFRPIAPFDRDHAKVIQSAFDRETGEPVPSAALLTVAEALGLYHLHPESKFHNADYLDRGVTERRHIQVTGIRHIGKEANRLEEQQFLGVDDEAQPDYGLLPDDIEARAATLQAAADTFGMASLARRAGMSAKVARRVLAAPGSAVLSQLEALSRAANEMGGEALQRADRHAGLIDWANSRRVELGITALAHAVRYDAKNLAKMLTGARPVSEAVLARLITLRAEGRC